MDAALDDLADRACGQSQFYLNPATQGMKLTVHCFSSDIIVPLIFCEEEMKVFVWTFDISNLII